MNDLMKLSQIIRSASTIYLTADEIPNETATLLPIQLIQDGRLYLGISSAKPLYQSLQENAPVTIVTSKEGNIMHYKGNIVFDKDDSVTNLVLNNNIALQAIYGKGKKQELKMFYLENASINTHSI